MKFRKRPVVVEANQHLHPSEGVLGVRIEEDGRCYVVTIQGQKVYVQPGEWIIQEPDGVHYYPCADAVFKATYEPIS